MHVARIPNNANEKLCFSKDNSSCLYDVQLTERGLVD